ncbi:hypothetical protein AVDCRST_MAG84-2616 [uncultured Microcoleus sp.]|uniref:Uncharacterized protein n=1 Tax=uncultured Microcoleus sp. TaxID=259945 RepID=A0A6J4M0W9_9CYAN|nr:hypothetical protein AVDCRST_MAG84-2616 [uncultured Microcoleus sp.]
MGRRKFGNEPCTGFNGFVLLIVKAFSGWCRSQTIVLHKYLQKLFVFFSF